MEQQKKFSDESLATLVVEAEQQLQRLRAVRDKLKATDAAEGTKQVMDELVDTAMSLLVDHLKLFQLALAGADDEASDEEDDDVPPSVLYDQDATFIGSTLQQHLELLTQVIDAQPEGDAKSKLKKLQVQARQAIALVDEITVNTDEEPDAEPEPAN